MTIRLKSNANYDTIWRGGIINPSNSGKTRYGYALVLADGTDTWTWLRVEDTGAGWVVVFEGEQVTPDPQMPWHLTKKGHVSKACAQAFAEELVA